MTIRLSQKGWVVIPAVLRQKYGLLPGAEVYVVDYGGVLAIVPAFLVRLNAFAGSGNE